MVDPVRILAASRSLILAGAISVAQDTIAILTEGDTYDLSDRLRVRTLEQARRSWNLLKEYESRAASEDYKNFPETDQDTVFHITDLLRKSRKKASNIPQVTTILQFKNLNGNLERALRDTSRHGEQQTVYSLAPSLVNSRPSMRGSDRLDPSVRQTNQSSSRIHCLFEPIDISPSGLDVIFVHGVNGHYQQTWQEGSTFWPTDFLVKDFPSARILAVSFSPNAFVNVSHNRLASDLLRDLGTFRKGFPARKLIWIAHSLGGIIVKSALVRAWTHRDERAVDWDICKSTGALLFFGTPHQSSSLSAWTVLYENIARATGRDPDTIKATSEFVREMSESATRESDKFKLFIDSIGVPIVSFFETKGMNTTAWVPLKVVDRHTQLHHPKEDVRFLEGNHVSISKFKDRTDPNYLQVVGCIGHISDQTIFLHPQSKISVLTDETDGSYIEKMVTAPTNLETEEVDIEDIEMKDRWSEFRKSLGVSRVSLGHDREKEPSQDHWFLHTEEFRDWFGGLGPQVLSLIGPPGCGKTTMARAITTFLQYGDAKTQRSRSFVIFFFFRSDYRLTLLSKLAKQPYRNARYLLLQTFVAQLLDQNPVLAGHVLQTMSRRQVQKIPLSENLHQSAGPSSIVPGTRRPWRRSTEEELLAILRSTLEDSCHAHGTVYCLIDALDQCDPTVAHSMSQMLNSLISIVGLRLVVTYHDIPSLSLPWKHLSNNLPFNIVQQKDFTTDMTKSLNSKAFLGSSSLPKSYRALKLDQRRNVFVSVESTKKQSKTLTSHEFNRMLFCCLRFGKTPANDHLLKNIAKWPSSNLVYGTFFENMINAGATTFNDSNVNITMKALDVLSCCYEPMRPSDLQHALLSSNSNNESEIFGSVLTDLTTFLKDCDQLIFLTGEGLYCRSRTLRSFLQTNGVDGYFRPRSNQEKSFRCAKLHVDMALSCLKFLLACHANENLKAKELTLDVPFLSYARTYWREHLIDAEGCSSDVAKDLKKAQRLAKRVQDIISRPDDRRRYMLSDSAASFENLDHGGQPIEKRSEATSEARTIEDLHLAMNSNIADTVTVSLREVGVFYEDSVKSQLREAVVKDREMEVKEILKSSDLLDIESLNPILRLAMRRRRLSVIKLFLEHYETNAQGSSMEVWTMGLEMAVEEHSMDTVQFICRTKPSVTHGRSLELAVSSCNINISNELLCYGADINDKRQGWTVLHIAAHSGPLRLVECLVDWGAKPGTRDGRRRKPIHCAAEAGHSDIVLYLCSIGSDVEDVDKKWRTPLFVACVGGWSMTVKILLDDGCDPNHRDNQGRTMLQVAAKKGARKVLEYLVAAGCDVSASDPRGKTPLHEAAEGGWVSAMKLILDHGAPVYAKDVNDWTALHYACKSTNAPEGVVGWLLSEGADPRVLAKKGWTPLHIAAEFSNAAVVTLLIDQGADVNLPDEDGLTPLHKACASKFSAHANALALLRHGAAPMPLAETHGDPIQYAISQTQDPEVVNQLRAELEDSHEFGVPRALGQNTLPEYDTAQTGEWVHTKDLDLDISEMPLTLE